MALFSHKQPHSDFNNYVHVEPGDPQAKDALDHLSIAILAIGNIVQLESKGRFVKSASDLSAKAMESVGNAAANWRFSVGDAEDLRNLALNEVKKALEIIGDKGNGKPEFESDRQMLNTILKEFAKNAGKSIDYEEALLIYTFLLVEAKDLGRMAEDKHFLYGNARGGNVSAVHPR